jgi:hypothetical protein
VRKRNIIAGVTLIVVGVSVYVLSALKDRSVEYHKNAFLNAHTSGRRIEQILARVSPRWASAYRKRKVDRIPFHRQALIDTGYLANKTYLISNRHPEQLFFDLPWVLSDGGVTFEFHAHPAGTLGARAYPIVELTDRVVRVIAVSNDMNKVDKLVGELERSGARGSPGIKFLR